MREIVLAISTAEISVVIAVLALGLSAVSLFMQRPQPRLEAMPVHDSGRLAVAVRNSGSAMASGIWMNVILKGKFSVSRNLGTGFLGSNEGRYVITNVPYPADQGPDALVGLVGCKKPNGDTLVWPMGVGKTFTFTRKRWRFWRRYLPKHSFQTFARAVHGDIGIGADAEVLSDTPLGDR